MASTLTAATAAAGPSTAATTTTPSTSQIPNPDIGPGINTVPENGAANKPELPWAFIDCPQDTLIVLITHMLNMLIKHNDQVVLTPDALTRFHSRAAPGISVEEYLKRIVRYTNMETIPLLSLLAYIDVTCQNLPTFTLSSLTVHRFLIAGVCVGSKAQCDVFCTNSHYAKVGGIKTNELNALEREFLKVTQWTLSCHSELLQRYYTSLIRSHGGYTQAPEPAISPFTSFEQHDPPNANQAEDTDTDMKQSGEISPGESTGSGYKRTATGIDEDVEMDMDVGDNEDVIQGSTPGGRKRRRRRRSNMDIEVEPEGAPLSSPTSPNSAISSSIPSSSRSSLRASTSSRGRVFSMSSFTSPRLAEPRVDPVQVTGEGSGSSGHLHGRGGGGAETDDVGMTNGDGEEVGARDGEHQASHQRSASISPTQATRSIPDNQHQSHAQQNQKDKFKQFVGGIFRRKSHHPDPQPSKSDKDPPQGQTQAQAQQKQQRNPLPLAGLRRTSRSKSPTPAAAASHSRQVSDTGRKISTASTTSDSNANTSNTQPPPAPKPRPDEPAPSALGNAGLGADAGAGAVTGADTETERGPLAPSDTPPDQIPVDPSMPAAPSLVVNRLATPDTSALAPTGFASATTEPLGATLGVVSGGGGVGVGGGKTKRVASENQEFDSARYPKSPKLQGSVPSVNASENGGVMPATTTARRQGSRRSMR